MTSYLIHIMMKSTTCAVIRGTSLDDVVSSSSHDDVKLHVIGGAVLEEIVSSSSHDDVKLLVIGGAVIDDIVSSSSHDDVNLLVIGGAVLDDAVVWPLGAGDVLVLVRGEGEEALAVVQSVLSAGVAAWQRRDGGKWVGRGNLKG